MAHPRFEMLRHDVTFPLYIEADAIYNLACPASPIHYQFDPVQTTKTSVHGAINMLGLAKRIKAKILQASTLGSLRRPRSSSANRGVLGPRQSRSEFVPATTKESAARRRCSSTIGVSIACVSRSCGSSTPTVRGCTQTMAASSRTLSCRR